MNVYGFDFCAIELRLAQRLNFWSCHPLAALSESNRRTFQATKVVEDGDDLGCQISCSDRRPETFTS